MKKRTHKRSGNHAAQEKFLAGLYQAIDAIDELLADHGPRCQCDPCHDFRWQRYTLQHYCDLAEFVVIPCPEMTRRSIAELKANDAEPWIIEALEASLQAAPA